MDMMRMAFRATLLTFVAAAAYGCTGAAGSADDRLLQFDTVAYSDSMEAAGGSAVCRLKVVYPVSGNGELMDSINMWIAGQMRQTGFSNDSLLAVPECHDMYMLAKICCDSALADARMQLSDTALVAIGLPVEYEYDADISPIYVSQKAITYSKSAYVYLGGAHGGVISDQLTFSRSDGRGYGWNMFRADSLSELLDMIRKGLAVQYFKTPEEMSENLLVKEDSIPLPVLPPYFMADGVHFVYKQYEISPYSAGMPSCVLGYPQIDSLLTPAAASLVP